MAILIPSRKAYTNISRSLISVSSAQQYEKLYEDNATGKVSDEWLMQLSHKYEVERLELKAKIKALRQKLSECGQCERDSETFTSAIRRFMRMDRLTAPLLRELIDHIDVFETEGTGKSRTQRIVIYYRFVGYVEIPEVSQRPASKQTPEKALPWSISPSRKQHNKKSRHPACSVHKAVSRQKNRVSISEIPYEYSIWDEGPKKMPSHHRK